MSLASVIQKSKFVHGFARAVLRLIGWRTQVLPPPTASYVLIGAPHTSNWDFVIVLLLMAAEKLPIRIMGKDSLFRGPIGVFMRSLGAIPVNRNEKTNLVDQVAAKFAEYDELVIGISPEGTRNKTTRWRTGFYYIALKAGVPIVMAYLDYENKVCGLGPSITPTGDIQADFMIIRDFYTGIKGKYPDNQGEVEFVQSPASTED
ncbi:MAG TPA: glycerol acyltransferase [Chloroflexi bacterium]|nr:glycerol acyltransferase [Chloroflexota bacterium]HBY09625.1 glycerol acyltransferase [Chloroflexota bacterium]